METILAFVVGGLYTAAVYLLLSRSMLKLIIGIIFLSHGANLLIFTASGLTPGQAPLVQEGTFELIQPYADPLPQALILTAIVISFGVLAFFLALVYRAYDTIGTDDLDKMKETDQ